MRARDERTATEKNQVLMFYLLGENLGGGFHIPLPPSPPPPSPLYVWRLNDSEDD